MGGGDLGSGVAIRLIRAGFPVVISELPEPMAVRRTVSFSEAIYDGSTSVEDITAVKICDIKGINEALSNNLIPVLVDPDMKSCCQFKPDILVDARMTKLPPKWTHPAAPFVIGLGPGFDAGKNCHAVVETNRGHFLGRVYWNGTAQPDTGIPGKVHQMDTNRVLRSPASGLLSTTINIGDWVDANQVVGRVNGLDIIAPFSGMIRGILRPNTRVDRGVKVGDMDTRNDPRLWTLVSEKSLAIGGGVLEAILSYLAYQKQESCL